MGSRCQQIVARGCRIVCRLSPIKDEIWYHLIASTDHDATAQELLEILCEAFSATLSRLVQEHLSGGVNCNPSAEPINETKLVSNTNVVSKRDFGKLDCLLCEKPNATTLSLEAMILFSNNKTMNWLTSKSPEEVQRVLQAARKVAQNSEDCSRRGSKLFWMLA